jgi:hypothetical protein
VYTVQFEKNLVSCNFHDFENICITSLTVVITAGEITSISEEKESFKNTCKIRGKDASQGRKDKDKVEADTKQNGDNEHD